MYMTELILEGVLLTAVALFGLASNLLAVLVLRHRSLPLRPSIRLLLIALAVFDEAFLLLALSQFGAITLLDPKGYHKLFLPYVLPLVQMALTGSVWTTVAVSVERYLTVCRNYRPRNIYSHTAIFYLVPIVVFSVAFNVCRFFEFRSGLRLLEEDEEEYYVVLDVTEMRSDPAYMRDYLTIANLVMMVLVPFSILIVLNTLIARKILAGSTRTAQQDDGKRMTRFSLLRREHVISLMLLVVVAIFIFCHSLRCIVNVVECLEMLDHISLDYSTTRWLNVVINVSHLALVFNSSINMFVYVFFDRRFRLIFLDLACCCCGLRGLRRRAAGRGERAAAGGGAADEIEEEEEEGYSDDDSLEMSDMAAVGKAKKEGEERGKLLLTVDAGGGGGGNNSRGEETTIQ